jgi:hypothetical protein
MQGRGRAQDPACLVVTWVSGCWNWHIWVSTVDMPGAVCRLAFVFTPHVSNRGQAVRWAQAVSGASGLMAVRRQVG